MSVLNNQSEAAPGVSLFAPASGGGGGGAGPNPQVSTISFPNNGTINYSTILTFNDNTTTTGNDFVINSGIPDSAFVVGFGNGGLASITSIRAPSAAATALNMGATDTAGCCIAATNPNTGNPSTLTIVADNTIIPNNLNVSSINGVAPGGGLPAAGAFSTLAVSSCMLVDGGSFNYQPVNDGTVKAPQFGVQIESSDGNSLYTRACANPTGLMDDFKGVSTATGVYGLRTLVNSQSAYFGFPSGPGGQDGSQLNLSFSTLQISAPSTFTLASPALTLAGPVLAPVGIGMSNTTLTLTAPGQSNAGALYFNSGTSNVYLTNPSTGTLCLGTQVQPAALQVGNNFVSIPSVGASISSLTVSSINGAAPGGGTSGLAFNKALAFTTGSDNTGQWYLNVDSNTGGVPQYLTAAQTLSTNHSYLVSCDIVSGSNSDTAQTSFTKLALQVSGGTDITLQTYSGFPNYWIYNGSAGSRSAIIRGAAAVRLYATNTSPSVSTLMIFDTATGLSVSDLGLSS